VTEILGPDKTYELAVVGAGPAGLAAASTAAAHGVATLLLDEQGAPGGQIYRSIGVTPVTDRRILGADYWRGMGLVAEFQASGAAYLPQATVWNISPERDVAVSTPAGARLFRVRHAILATGAMERPFPIPGWTLPGVMTAGAAQILLKSAGLVGEGSVVLAGCGPLLWLLAAQYLEAGARISALLDTTPRANRPAALAHLPRFLTSPYLGKGWRLLRAVKRHVPVIAAVSELQAAGEGRLQEVLYRQAAGPVRRLPADLLLLHQGVVPNLNFASALGCRHVWDERQLCFRPVVDGWGASSVEGIAIAGDGAGIAGAQAAAERGRLAGLDAALRLGRLDEAGRDRTAGGPRVALARAERGREFLDALYRPATAFRLAADDTIVCRCEEVTAGQVREAVAQGGRGPNQVKAFLRCGMGPCQGRLCGLTVTELIAEATGRGAGEVGYYRLRPPVKPVSLAELASLPKPESAVRAVERI
jgi:NADPH-dependent 2,4-dienoyl-CoA reductase/sulfur reductase-like enzyme